MVAPLASVWLMLLLTFSRHTRSQVSQDSRDTATCDPFQSVGQAIAEHACVREATSGTLLAVHDAAAAAVATCAGLAIDVDAAATAMADGFDSEQSCDCETGRQVVELSSRTSLALANDGPDTGNSFDKLAESVRVFSDAYCSPGTKNGILDQSAEECSVMSQGNATVLSTRLGTEFGERWCALDGAPDPVLKQQLSVLASESLGNATTRAVSDTEFACSFTPSVLCALSDAQVVAVARAQLNGFAKGMVVSTKDNCNCGLDATAIIATITLEQLDAAVSTHAAVCESSQAQFDNMAGPLRDLVQPGVDAALANATCQDSSLASEIAPSPANDRATRPQSVYPYAKCGSNDYALALADGEAKQVAPAIATECCTPGYACVVKSRWYASCRPAGERPSPEWNGTVVTLTGCEAVVKRL